MYRYHKPVKLKVFTRVEQFISNEIGYLTPNLEWLIGHTNPLGVSCTTSLPEPKSESALKRVHNS